MMADDDKKRDLEPGAAPTGRVKHDSRGQTVWEWTDEERSASTSELLRFLDNDALSLEPTQAIPVPAGPEPASASGEATETTSAVLRRLDNGGFSLEATWKVSVPRELRREAGPDTAGNARRNAPRRAACDAALDDEAPSRDGNKAGGGFNPYDHS